VRLTGPSEPKENYCGKLSANPHDHDSTSNPYGAGNPYNPSSPTNPYGHGLRIEGR